jgi:N-formylglutamate amidohydrolase
MAEKMVQAGDSVLHGGSIPGAPGTPAFTLEMAEPSTIPMLIAVPHAGRAYPPSLVERMRNPAFALLRLEDRYADLLGRRVAAATGASLLVAKAPRAMLDLNRASDDVDWDMFPRGTGDRLGSYEPGRRARTGLGLIPRRLPGLGELWKRRHDESDLSDRIAGIHEPYHACLEAALERLRDRWGAALLLDLHSMPPLPRQGSSLPPEFVLGDRFGASCAGALVASAFAYFNEQRRMIAHNRPYAGGYVLERHARPQEGIHAFQLEIDRTSYLDVGQSEPGDGFAETVRVLTGLVQRMAGEVADLGRASRPDNSWAEAAE